MLIEVIVGSLAVIANVTTVLQYRHLRNNTRWDGEQSDSLIRIQEQVSALQNAVAQPPHVRNDRALLAGYNALLNTIKKNNLYNSTVEFRPTNYGTWRLVMRKRVILRDPEGEYGKCP